MGLKLPVDRIVQPYPLLLLLRACPHDANLIFGKTSPQRIMHFKKCPKTDKQVISLLQNPEQLCLKWNDIQKNLSSAFGTLRNESFLMGPLEVRRASNKKFGPSGLYIFACCILSFVILSYPIWYPISQGCLLLSAAASRDGDRRLVGDGCGCGIKS